jgi:CDP-glucose 4,6-dehydratase
MSRRPDPDFWKGRRVLLTGHSGFKGSWTALWLERMGAEVTGLALPPDTDPSLFSLAKVDDGIASRFVDIRDREAVDELVRAARPQIVLHLAAQPLVRRSLRIPVETIATNVMGATHLLESLRHRDGVEAILVVTSDKVYANAERGLPFAENDTLGGKDPYSASKASVELVTVAYAASFFDELGIPLATARAGNVVGGGNFSEDRIVPDLVRAVRSGETLILRHPEAVRPWQHVLDCIAGYLIYAEALAGGENVPRALNFGPEPTQPVTVAEFTEALQTALDVDVGWKHEPVPGSVEAKHLTLDSDESRRLLDWRDRLPGRDCVSAVAEWYRAWMQGADMREATLSQIAAFELRD